MQVDLESRLQQLEAENESLRTPSASQYSAAASNHQEESSSIDNPPQGGFSAYSTAPVEPPFSGSSPNHQPHSGGFRDNHSAPGGSPFSAFSQTSAHPDAMQGKQPEGQTSARNNEANDLGAEDWGQGRQNAMLRNAVEDSIHTGNLLGDRYSNDVSQNHNQEAQMKGNQSSHPGIQQPASFGNDKSQSFGEASTNWAPSEQSPEEIRSNSRTPPKNEGFNDGRLGSQLGLRSQDEEIQSESNDSYQRTGRNDGSSRSNKGDLDSDVVDILV